MSTVRPGLHWQDVELLLAVERARSLSLAAKALGVDQSTVSRRLRQLEDHLDCALFVRSKSGVLPTQTAKALLPLAEDAETSIRRLETTANRMGTTARGRVRLAVPGIIAEYMLVPSLPDLFVSHPDVELDLLTQNEVLDLNRFEADVALRPVKPSGADLVVKSVARAEYGVYASEAYASRIDGTTNARDLDWIGWDPAYNNTPTAKWFQQTVGIEPRIRCTQYHTIVKCVVAGLGAGIFPVPMGESIPGLTRVSRIALPKQSLELWLAGQRSVWRSPHVRAVTNWIGNLLRTMEKKLSHVPRSAAEATF